MVLLDDVVSVFRSGLDVHLYVVSTVSSFAESPKFAGRLLDLMCAPKR